jgi:hypothetical protein
MAVALVDEYCLTAALTSRRDVLEIMVASVDVGVECQELSGPQGPPKGKKDLQLLARRAYGPSPSGYEHGATHDTRSCLLKPQYTPIRAPGSDGLASRALVNG